MKTVILLFLLVLTHTIVFSQEIVPTIKGDTALIKKYKIKSVSIHYKNLSTRESLDNKELVKIDYNKSGNITFEKYYSIFDVIYYSNEYFYKYNRKGRLIEKSEIQKEYPQNEKDSLMLKFTRKLTKQNSTNKTWHYFYDKNGNIIKEEGYDNNEESKLPILEAIYQYDSKNRKIKVIFTHINNPKSRQNKLETYEYDNSNRLIKMSEKQIAFKLETIELYEYDEQNRLIKTNRDSGYNSITIYTKKYDSKNKLIEEGMYNQGFERWSRVDTLIYENNNLVKKITKGDKGQEWQETYQSYPNGLTKEEVHYDGETQKPIYSFITTYTYW
ncbi:MAG: hypothetical protein EAZ08_03805 [Cytophagales bacterium]|nr:MAG: hypothetical protein EAZ08_03805 [Cytophagales bacterium]